VLASQDTHKLSAYRAVVKALPAQFHEPMNKRALENLSATLNELNVGGDLSRLGLGVNIAPLANQLGEENIDMQSALASLDDGRLRRAKAKVELVGDKLDRRLAKLKRRLKYLLLAAILSALSVLMCLVRLLILAKSNIVEANLGSDRLAIESGKDRGPVLDRKPLSEEKRFIVDHDKQGSHFTFADRLLSLVNEQTRDMPFVAKVNCKGFDLQGVPIPLVNVCQRIAENLVFNSVAHGGRSVQERVLAGKPEYLSINVHFVDRGDAYLLSVEDDGEGFEPVKIISRAKELGLIPSNVTVETTLQNSAKYLFIERFSTKNNTRHQYENDLKLNALRELARQFNGVFSLQNQFGRYCRFSVRFPKPLAS